ncbi:MAG: response regulator transcription factor [Anaerolineales bacterium]|nr:response regulator transcription factor [Anaerolineales bacterium]
MKKILIVDDDISITLLLEKILSRAGFSVVVVNESSQAMRKAQELNPDLFILDLMMPQPNGFEVCRALRADATFSNTPILIITASDDYDSKAIAYAAGASDYITKPFDHEELITRIKEVL